MSCFLTVPKDGRPYCCIPRCWVGHLQPGKCCIWTPLLDSRAAAQVLLVLLGLCCSDTVDLLPISSLWSWSFSPSSQPLWGGCRRCLVASSGGVSGHVVGTGASACQEAWIYWWFPGLWPCPALASEPIYQLWDVPPIAFQGFWWVSLILLILAPSFKKSFGSASLWQWRSILIWMS